MTTDLPTTGEDATFNQTESPVSILDGMTFTRFAEDVIDHGELNATYYTEGNQATAIIEWVRYLVEREKSLSLTIQTENLVEQTYNVELDSLGNGVVFVMQEQDPDPAYPGDLRLSVTGGSGYLEIENCPFKDSEEGIHHFRALVTQIEESLTGFEEPAFVYGTKKASGDYTGEFFVGLNYASPMYNSLQALRQFAGQAGNIIWLPPSNTGVDTDYCSISCGPESIVLDWRNPAYPFLSKGIVVISATNPLDSRIIAHGFTKNHEEVVNDIDYVIRQVMTQQKGKVKQ